MPSGELRKNYLSVGTGCHSQLVEKQSGGIWDWPQQTRSVTYRKSGKAGVENTGNGIEKRVERSWTKPIEAYEIRPQ
jgi:hypothetical protein